MSHRLGHRAGEEATFTKQIAVLCEPCYAAATRANSERHMDYQTSFYTQHVPPLDVQIQAREDAPSAQWQDPILRGPVMNAVLYLVLDRNTPHANHHDGSPS